MGGIANKNKVIIKLDELPEKEKQPTLVGGMPIFDWRLVHLIDDEEDDMGEKKYWTCASYFRWIRNCRWYEHSRKRSGKNKNKQNWECDNRWLNQQWYIWIIGRVTGR